MLILKSYKIKKIIAREILDSRGNPTIEVEVQTGFGSFRASAPSGASKGEEEALELRDGNERYLGLGVLKALKNVNEIIAPKLRGENSKNQKRIDNILRQLDGTEQKSKLGGNAICATSMAVCKAGAGQENLFFHVLELFNPPSFKGEFQLPKPSFNVINGGVHAGNDLDIQEFMILPQKENFSENLRMGSEVYHTLKDILKEKFGKIATNVGDEGGLVPPIFLTREALDLIFKAILKRNYENFFKISLDCAASQFFKENFYHFEKKKLTSKELMDFYIKLVKDYPIISLEDPFSQNESHFFKLLKEALKEIIIFGDDILVSNPQKIKQNKENCSGLILKINQIGTVTEALESANLAKKFGWKIMVSHRSGETQDDFISDFAVGILADFIKAGAPCRGERVVKYNRLLKIEEILKKKNEENFIG